MPKPIPYKFRLAYFLTFVLVFLVGFPVLVFYSAGYRFDEAYDLTARGGIYVSTPEPDTSVFIGSDPEVVSGFFKREVMVNKLKPGPYLVFVANDLFWPWTKLATVERGEVEALFPLLVPKVIEPKELLTTDTKYKETAALFTETATTTRTARKLVKVWLDDESTTIYAQWLGSAAAAPKYFCELTSCFNPVKIFHAIAPIRTFDFYPLRQDAIILAVENGMYAVELDHRTHQNYYPLFSGIAPDFRINDDDEVYVKDEGEILFLNLEQ